MLISFAVTAKLICVFVFAQAKSRFSYNAAHIVFRPTVNFFYILISGFGAAWHLAYIEVEDLGTRKVYTFHCNKWLSKSEDDKQILRELTCGTSAKGSSPDMRGDRISMY